MKPVIAGILVATNGLGLVTMFAQSAEVRRTGGWDPTIMGQVLILLTTLLGFAYTIYRESRNRRWDLEDRERARHDFTRRVESVKAEQRTHGTINTRAIVAKIDENTAVNAEAIAAANQHNQKIADLTKLFLEGQDPPDVLETMHHAADTLHRVDDNTKETVQRLRRMKHDE